MQTTHNNALFPVIPITHHFIIITGNYIEQTYKQTEQIAKLIKQNVTRAYCDLKLMSPTKKHEVDRNIYNKQTDEEQRSVTVRVFKESTAQCPQHAFPEW